MHIKKRSTCSYARNAFVDHVCPRRQGKNIFSVCCKGGNAAVHRMLSVTPLSYDVFFKTAISLCHLG